MKVTFRPLSADDLPKLVEWFELPHVKQWYARSEKYTLDMIREKYLPRIHDVDNIPNYIVYLENESVGYIQEYRLTYSLPDGVNDGSHSIFDKYKPTELVGIDLFVADEKLLGTGFCSIMINQFIEQYLQDNFRAVIVDPVKDNIRAIKFFEKNGFKSFVSSNSKSNHVLLIRELAQKVVWR